MAKGIERGITGKAQGWGSRVRETYLAPETVIPEHSGRLLGKDVGLLNPGRQYRALKKMRKAVGMTGDVKNAPGFEDVVGGINRVLWDPKKGAPRTLPKFGPEQRDTLLHKASPYVLAPFMGVTPGVNDGLVHMGVNRARIALGQSSFGKKFMRQSGVEGLTSPGGTSPLKETAWDYIVSPAARSTRRMGAAFASEAGTSTGRDNLRRLAGAVHTLRGNSRVKEDASTALSRLRDYIFTLG